MPQSRRVKVSRRLPRVSIETGPLGAGEPTADPLVVRRIAGKRRGRPKKIRFDYLKSTLYRVVHADGFHGGLTPGGKVHMAIFNERKPIARSEVYSITPQRTLGHIEARIERDGIVREVEVSILMDLDKAFALRAWLDTMFKQVEELQRTARAARRK